MAQDKKLKDYHDSAAYYMQQWDAGGHTNVKLLNAAMYYRSKYSTRQHETIDTVWRRKPKKT